MTINGIIFDLDGTLLDSMHMWSTLGSSYIEGLGASPCDNLNEIIASMSMVEAATYCINEYSLSLTVDEFLKGVQLHLKNFYLNDAKLKPNVKNFLDFLKKQNIKMCIATATDISLIEDALRRLGLTDYFSRIFTCSEVGAGKTNPLIYRMAQEHLGLHKENILIFEDALYALKTAKGDDYHVVGIFDESESNTNELIKLADFYIEDYSDYESFWQLILTTK